MHVHHVRSRRCTRLLLALALVCGFGAFSPTTTHAATLNVCPSGCAYTSLRSAISSTSNGNTINIGACTYHGGIDITKNVTLVGAGAGVTIIEGNDAPSTHGFGLKSCRAAGRMVKLTGTPVSVHPRCSRQPKTFSCLAAQ